MNKYLTLTLAALAVSQVQAANVDLGAAMTVSGGIVENDKALVGLTLSAEHYTEITENSSVFVGSQFYVPGKALTDGGPIAGNIVAGASFNSKALPASVQLGLAAVAQSPANSEDSIVFAPGIISGTKFNVNENWHVKTNVMLTLPMDKSAQVSEANAMLASSFGVVHTIAIADA